jgi:hypothetical protein
VRDILLGVYHTKTIVDMGAKMTNGETPKKKGLPTIAWIGIGCGVLALVMAVVVGSVVLWGFGKVKEAGFDPELMKENPALAMARMAINASPDLEEVEYDEESTTRRGASSRSAKRVPVRSSRSISRMPRRGDSVSRPAARR